MNETKLAFHQQRGLRRLSRLKPGRWVEPHEDPDALETTPLEATKERADER